MKTIAISIEDDLLDGIDRLNVDSVNRTNRSKIIREAVREYLIRAERMAEEDRETTVFRKHRRLLAREASALVREQAKP